MLLLLLFRFICNTRGTSTFVSFLLSFPPHAWRVSFSAFVIGFTSPLGPSANSEVTLLYTMFVSNNRVSLYLWWKENLVKYQKFSKHYEIDCLLGFLLPFMFFSHAINQFDGYFDNSTIVIWKFTDHFHQAQFTVSHRVTTSQSSANLI